MSIPAGTVAGMNAVVDILYRYRIAIAAALVLPGLAALALAHRSQSGVDKSTIFVDNSIAAACFFIAAIAKIDGDRTGLPNRRLSGSAAAIFGFLLLISGTMPSDLAWLEAIALGAFAYAIAGVTVPIRTQRGAIIGERFYWLVGLGTFVQGLSFLWAGGSAVAGFVWLFLICTYVALPHFLPEGS